MMASSTLVLYVTPICTHTESGGYWVCIRPEHTDARHYVIHPQ